MNHDQLRGDLDKIRTQATSVLKTERRKRARRPALEGALLIGVVLAAAYLLYLGLAYAIGASLPSPTLPVLAAVIVAAGLIYLVARIVAAGSRAVSDAAALAAADERHDLKDRLRTAAEFLRRPSRTPFMDAALLDAADFSPAARQIGLPVEPAPESFSGRARNTALCAAPLLALALWIPMPVAAEVTQDDPNKVEVTRLEIEADADNKTPEERPAVPREQEEPSDIKATPVPRPAASQKGRKDTQLSSDVKLTRGAMGSGQSADAASASGTSEARGAPSNQAQASKAAKKPTKKKNVKKKKPKKPDSEPTPVVKPEADSGSTAGRGAASGSNKSPSASPWSSRDQVTSEDEEELEDDEEVDDEFDNSDARGGVQPHLRDRRPPVNRDLGIGFGNQKNPDANGRGGPSEQKKSRGVASLVLGVPIPDHVKGRPNPGKTKITQERVEPKVEDAATVSASARKPRKAKVGHFANPELEAWMRELIRAYFQAIRPNLAKNPK